MHSRKTKLVHNHVIFINSVVCGLLIEGPTVWPWLASMDRTHGDLSPGIKVVVIVSSCFLQFFQYKKFANLNS